MRDLIFGCRRSHVDGLVSAEVLPRSAQQGEGEQEHEPVLQVRQPVADPLHVVAIPGGAGILLLRLGGDEGVRSKMVNVRRRAYFPHRLHPQWRCQERFNAHPRPNPPRHRCRLRQSGCNQVKLFLESQIKFLKSAIVFVTFHTDRL